MYLLLQSQLRQDDEGNPVVLNGALSSHWATIANLKQMDLTPSVHLERRHGSAAGGRGSGAITPTQRQLDKALREVENPDLAKALK